MKQNFKKDMFVTGFAMFAMFFGAGNLIFPPFLGWTSGKNWIVGFLSFILVDVGLAMLALLVVAKIGKGAMGISEKLGKNVSFVIMALNVICLGPLIAIPRTGATTFEFAVKPVFTNASSWVFSAIFFGIVIILSIRQTKAIDITGTVLAPIMFLALIYLVFVGAVSPIGEIVNAGDTTAVIKEGVLSGYQTMDLMAALVFSAGLLVSVKDKGYRTVPQQFKILAFSGVVCAAALFVVYGGLTYLGATISSVYETAAQSDLLIRITNELLGGKGVIALGVIVGTACLTTAIGLVSSSASFFAQATDNKINYKVTVVVVSLVSFLLSNMGINTIIQFAAPILDLIYPVLVVLIFMGLFKERIKSKHVYMLTSIVTLATCVIIQLEKIVGRETVNLYMPLGEYGFAWVLPAVITLLVSNALIKSNK